MGLGDVMKATDRQHKHGVDVYLLKLKDGCEDGDGGQNADLCHLAKLALVISTDIPLDVLLKGGPPKPVEECAVDGVEALMSQMVVSVVNQGKMRGRRDVKLMPALVLTTPESSICK